MPAKEPISDILNQYQLSFSAKTYDQENAETDLLMDLFNITSEIKLENKQYWSRELGFCWQRIITEVVTAYRDDSIVPVRENGKEIFDTGFGEYAIDTKYRIGSGDSGTMKKLRDYAQEIRELGKTPILLILRTDSRKRTIRTCEIAGWRVICGEDAFTFIEKETGFDLRSYLIKNKGSFSIERN